MLASFVSRADEPTDSWMPLEVGRSWTYDYERERSESSSEGGSEGAGTVTETEHFRGTLRDVVNAPAPAFASTAVVVTTDLRGRTRGGEETAESRRAVLEPHRSGYRIHALEAEDPIFGLPELNRYDPPLEQLRLGSGEPPTPTWDVGTLDLSGIRARLTATVVGSEDVDTPSGRYPNCLAVRFEGKLEGSYPSLGGRVEVTGGSIVSTEWFSRGVGLVRAEEQAEQTIRLPDGSTATLTERSRYVLRETAADSTPAARRK